MTALRRRHPPQPDDPSGPLGDVLEALLAETPEQRRDRHLRSTYGLSLAQYQALLTYQDGRCAICTEEPGDKPLHVDHDHSCCPGRRSCGACIRGLVCDPCNRGLAAFRDNPERLLAAVTYLKEHNS